MEQLTREEIVDLIEKYNKACGKDIPIYGAMPTKDRHRYWEIIRECIKTGIPYDESKYRSPGPKGTTQDGWLF